MKVNQFAPDFLLPMTNNLTKDMLRMSGAGKLGKGNYAKSRTPDVAPPLTHNYLKDERTYRTGMGDTFHQPQRPGADHSHIKSKGFPC